MKSEFDTIKAVLYYSCKQMHVLTHKVAVFACLELSERQVIQI